MKRERALKTRGQAKRWLLDRNYGSIKEFL